MGLEKEIWARDLAENIYPNNEAYKLSIDDSDKVDGKIVHLQESGSEPEVVENPTTFPMEITERDDVPTEYTINTFATKPVLLPDDETIELSYPKRISLLADHIGKLTTQIADYMYWVWGATAASLENVVETSGSDRDPFKAGQTGTRKAIGRGDIEELSRLMDMMDIPDDGRRVLLVDSNMFKDLTAINEYVGMDFIGKAGIDLSTGQAGYIMNFKIYKRSRVLTYDNSLVKKARYSTMGANDRLACLAWHPAFVRRAEGNTTNGGIKIFAKEDEPEYLGSIFNAKVRAGGKTRYINERGVVSLVEALGA
jgi:hypothetical protein